MICNHLHENCSNPIWMSIGNYIINKSSNIYWPYFGLSKLKELKDIENSFWVEVIEILKDIN